MLPIATNWSMSNWVHVKLLRLYQDPTVVIILESTGSQGFHKPTANTKPHKRYRYNSTGVVSLSKKSKNYTTTYKSRADRCIFKLFWRKCRLLTVA